MTFWKKTFIMGRIKAKRKERLDDRKNKKPKGSKWSAVPLLCSTFMSGPAWLAGCLGLRPGWLGLRPGRLGLRPGWLDLRPGWMAQKGDVQTNRKSPDSKGLCTLLDPLPKN